MQWQYDFTRKDYFVIGNPTIRATRIDRAGYVYGGGTLSKGQTFGASESITNTKLHNLVDLGSVSGIVNADIDASAQITDSKLADISTAGKVSGAVLTSLASIPSGAGVIPSANVPAGSPFVTGDWIISSVTTAHSGWTNVSATYSNKFIRINGTPLTTGGADTHTHGVGTYTSPTSGSTAITEANLPAHTHGVGTLVAASDGAHTHAIKILGAAGSGYTVLNISTADKATAPTFDTNSGGAHTHTISGSTGSTGSGTGHTHTGGTITGTSASANNIPAYVQCVIFQKD